MEKGDYSLYSWWNPVNDNAFVFNQTFNEDPEIGYWVRTADFRRALSYLVDRDALNQVLQLGLGTIHSEVPPVGFNPWAPGGVSDLIYTTYDVEVASKMLDDLGLVDTDGDGFRNRTGVLGGDKGNLELFVPIPGHNEKYAVKAQIFKEAFEEVGLLFDFKVQPNNLTSDKDYMAISQPVGYVMNLNPFLGYVVAAEAHGGFVAPAVGKWFETSGNCDFPTCQAPTGGMDTWLPLAASNTWPMDGDGEYFKLWQMKKEGQQFPNQHPENLRIGKEMWAIAADLQYRVSNVCCSPDGGIQLTRNNLRNVPKNAAPYYNGNYTELYYFEDGLDNMNNPGNRSKLYKSESFMTGLTY